MAQPSRAPAYLFLFFALIASAVALFFLYYGAKLVYLVAIFGSEASLGQGMSIVLGVFSYLTVVTAAVLFPFIALFASAVAWFSWKAGKRRLKVSN